MTRVSPRSGAGNGRTRKRAAGGGAAGLAPTADGVAIRAARRADLDQVIAIDAGVTGVEKRAYWLAVFRRYGDGEQPERHFLVAETGGRVAGFIIGEVRDWEFGAPPCGWVFAIDVAPEFRLAGIATRLLQALRAGFRRSGVRKLRTILARDNTLILSFFRSQGMMTGPFIPLEMDLDA
jgi:ribosomal protein S18 acetylase RimI-like enzyme